MRSPPAAPQSRAHGPSLTRASRGHLRRVIYGGDERVKWSVSLPPSTILPLIEELRLANRATFVFTETRVLLVNAEVGGPDWLEIAGRYDKNVEDHVAGRDAVLADIASGKMTIIKVTVVAEPLNVETLMASLRTSYPDLGLTRAIPFILELHDPHTDKGTALQYICDSLGLKTENAMVFGDGENDVAMFRKAGYSVAMGNGMQAAKAAASHQCPSNDEGGVGQFLAEVFGRGAAL